MRETHTVAPLLRLSPITVDMISHGLRAMLIPLRRGYPQQGLNAGRPMFQQMSRGDLEFTLEEHSVLHHHPFHLTYARMSVPQPVELLSLEGVLQFK